MAAKRKSHPIKIASDDFLYTTSSGSPPPPPLMLDPRRLSNGDIAGHIGDDLTEFEARLAVKRQELLETSRRAAQEMDLEEKR